MPSTVKIEANPAFKPGNPEEEAALKAVKAKGPIEVSYITAVENVRLSRGLYRIVPQKSEEPVAVKTQSLESMTAMELKEMATKLGITIRKERVKKDDLIFVIRERLGQIEIVDEDDEVEPDE